MRPNDWASDMEVGQPFISNHYNDVKFQKPAKTQSERGKAVPKEDRDSCIESSSDDGFRNEQREQKRKDRAKDVQDST